MESKAVSGIMLTLLLISMLTLAFNVQPAKAFGTIYIRADGSVDPSAAPIQRDGDLYIFTNDITDSIVIERDGIILDGAGYAVQGPGAYDSKGIHLTGRNNVTIKNIKIKSFWYGIWLDGSSNNTITDNNMANNYAGIGLRDCSNNSISGNLFMNDGLVVFDSYGNVVVDNLVNDKPLVYLEGISHLNVVEAGQVILVNCEYIQVKNLNLSHTTIGLQLLQTKNTIISGNNITKNRHGIGLSWSSNNTITGNNVTASKWSGIWLEVSSNNHIAGNNIANNGNGITLYESSNNTITGNNMINNNPGFGIGLEVSSNDNTITGNNMTANLWCGIWVNESTNNTINGNNVTNNEYGIRLRESTNNTIFHNNFINNLERVLVTFYKRSGVNFWDNSYPSGGNYWSDYAGVDLYSGPHQNERGSDGIGDTPYLIDADNTDRYPLMAPFKSFDAGTWNGKECNVDVVSNSTVTDFQLNIIEKWISFNVSGSESTTGFCRVTVPNIIVQSLWRGNYTVLLNGVPWPFENWTDAENAYIYANYAHSEYEITIIPEIPSTMTLPLFMALIMLAVVFARKRLPRKPKT